MSALNAPNARPLPAAHPDPEREPRRIILRMLALIAVLLVLTLAWAMFAQLDVSVNGRGAITPPSHLQEVQSLEGGIVREMLVKPGQRVRRGDLLLRLDTAQYEANLGASVQNRLAALAGRARLDAL
ncbi:MAG: biotin/lipoyl-binding protein, partial [Janthinobacterium sp.]